MKAAIAGVMQEVAARHATSITFKQIFAGISDMSYLGHRPDTTDGAIIKANTPASVFADDAPADLLAFPVVNIGPWGRDYHHFLERTHADYTFRVLPALLREVVGDVLGPAAAD